jgi:nucleoside-diphosphate-sugar epimerase
VKILVTGHHGFIGSALAPVLQDAGHEVVGLDTKYYEGCDLGIAERPPSSELRMDVRDVTAADLEGFDAVVHLAALSNDPVGELDTQLTADINFGGTMRLAHAARDAGVSRFVFASSCSMYGAGGGDAPIDETAPLMPLTAYAESKVRCERALTEIAGPHFTPTFMRNATAYGASPRLRLDVVLNNLTGWAYTTGRVMILSDGTPWRPLVHVLDIAGATLALLEAEREFVHAQAFNIGAAEENYRVRDIADVVHEHIDGCEIEYAGDGDPDPRSYRVDFSKFADAFPEFSFRWSARKGVAELVDAFSETGFDTSAFEGDRFVRLRRLRALIGAGRLDPDLRWAGEPAGT